MQFPVVVVVGCVVLAVEPFMAGWPWYTRLAVPIEQAKYCVASCGQCESHLRKHLHWRCLARELINRGCLDAVPFLGI